jgi:hypothetical protein
MPACRASFLPRRPRSRGGAGRAPGGHRRRHQRAAGSSRASASTRPAPGATWSSTTSSSRATSGRPRAPRHLLPADPEAEAWATRLVGELAASPVLVNLGASKPANRWAPERFGALARALSEDRLAVCFTGGPDDRAAAERARTAAGNGPRDLVGQTSLRQLVALLRRARPSSAATRARCTSPPARQWSRSSARPTRPHRALRSGAPRPARAAPVRTLRPQDLQPAAPRLHGGPDCRVGAGGSARGNAAVQPGRPLGTT